MIEIQNSIKSVSVNLTTVKNHENTTQDTHSTDLTSINSPKIKLKTLLKNYMFTDVYTEASLQFTYIQVFLSFDFHIRNISLKSFVDDIISTFTVKS
jgi:hypothetical protein